MNEERSMKWLAILFLALILCLPSCRKASDHEYEGCGLAPDPEGYPCDCDYLKDWYLCFYGPPDRTDTSCNPPDICHEWWYWDHHDPPFNVHMWWLEGEDCVGCYGSCMCCCWEEHWPSR